MIDINDGSHWTLDWKQHPTKTMVFIKHKDTIKVCGEGFQGPTDPPPMAIVKDTSLGEWKLQLDCDSIEGGWSSLSVDYAREIWNGLINQGWQVRV